MKLSFLFATTLLLIFTSCQEPQPKIENPVTEVKEFPAFFQKVLDAHGGWDTWNKMNTLKFTSTRNNPQTNYTVDLKTRKEVIEAPGKYTLGNNGEQVWVSPVRDSFPGKSPRFMKNLVFYFVAIPFVFADDGVNLEDLGIQKVNGLDYQVIKATFGDGVGDAPEDIYQMYVNPNTSKVHFITYSVTYFDKSRATKYNALKYEWENVNGLLFPTKYIGYKWEDGQLGDERYQSPFSNAMYSKEVQDTSMFSVPEGAWAE